VEPPPVPETPPPTPRPEPTPTAPPPTPEPTPTPTVDVSASTVLLLQSDARVDIYRRTAAALAGALPGQVRLQDLAGDRERGRTMVGAEAADADLVVAVGALAAALAREEVRGKPLLYCAVLNPERYDLSARGIAGVSFEVSPEEQLRGVAEALPGRTRIGVIYDPGKSGPTVAAAERAAGALGLRIVKQQATRPEDVDFLFRSLRPEIDVLWLLPDSTVVTRESFELLALHAAEWGIPLVAFAEAFTRQGALLSFYPDPVAVGRQCAALAARLLSGETSPEEIGARTPDRFACAVNRRIGGLLGVSVPPGMCVEVGG
jgi:putative tryptophan/tyrosine transport system substrate-binding protein